MKSLLIATVAVVLTTVAPVYADKDASKKDFDKIQGEWSLVTLHIEGKPAPEDRVKASKMTFKGNEASHVGQNGKLEKGTFKLDASKTPKAIDISPSSGPQKGETLLGIYSIEGETLTICGAKLGDDRPKEIKPGKDVVYMVFKRAKS